MATEYRGGIRRIINASKFSWQGLKAAYKYEAAFRLEVLLAVLLVPAAFLLGSDAAEKAILLATLLLVLIVELLNSAIESAVDRLGGELHELSGRAKDLGSAAVFLTLVNVILVWLLVLLV